MAASSSAKFFVHQNQNKANSSSAASAFADDSSSDVVEFIEFPTEENEDENLGNLTRLQRNTSDNAFVNNCRGERSTEDLSEPFVDIEEVISKATVIVSSGCGSQQPAPSVNYDSAQPEEDIESQLCASDKEINNNQPLNYNFEADHIQPEQRSSSYSVYPTQPKSNNEAITATQLQMKNLVGQAHQQRHQLQQHLPAEAGQLQLRPAPRSISGTGITITSSSSGNSIATKTPATILNIRAPSNAMNSSQQTQAAPPGNRITFTNQSLPNGTINIGGGHPGAAGSTIISTSQLPNTTTIKTITSSGAGAQHHGLPQQVQVQHHQVLQSSGPQQAGQPSQQQQQHNAQSVGATQTQTLVIKSNHAVSLPAGLVSSAPGIVTMTKTINQGNQPILNSMIPASVVVGMRPPNAQQQQKNMGRVVISNTHMVGGARPQSPAITLSTLTPGQTPALILKTENGFQLLRVGTATSGPVTQTIGTNSTNSTQIRLQTVPAASMAVTSSSNNIVVNSVASNSSTPHVYTSQANITLQQQQQQQQTSGVSIQQQQQQQQQIHHQTQHLHSQPQITQIQTIPPQQSQQSSAQSHLQQTAGNATTMNNSNVSSTTTGSTVVSTTTQSTAAQGNTKEKCRKFLANLIDLSTREPRPVEKNVRTLIQELVNANVEPEEFCDRLERLLNASPQPCLIGFLKKSLPLLRQALFTRELVIEGIKPPPQHVAGITTLQQQLPKIQAQIRPISQNQTTTIGQTQVRMISPASAIGPRPIGHTTITKQPAGIRIQGPTNGPRLINAQIRGPIPATIQQQQPQTNAQLQTAPTQANIVHIRAPTVTQISRPTTVQIRTTKGKNATAGITHVKVGQTQIKAISSPTPIAPTNQPPSLTAISNNAPLMSLPTSTVVSSASSILSTINSVAATYSIASGSGSGSALPTPSLPTVQLPPAALNNSIAVADTKIVDLKPDVNKAEKVSPATPVVNKTAVKSSTASATKASSKKKREQQDKEKDEKTNTLGSISTVPLSAFYQQPSISMSSSLYGDDDINDVAAMGGVNLAEESQRILGCTENIGTQIRSCKDEVFLHLPALQARIRAMVMERGLEEPSQDVAVLISHACQERLKNIVEKLAVIAEHRIDVIKLDPRYEVTKDVRGQIKFLEELDKAEQKRHEELEREMLLRAAKSRSKIEDPEQAKMKARAKEMQRAEMEELRQRDANMTALQAIGPRKKLKLDGDATGVGVSSGASGVLGASSVAAVPLRPRIKRVNLRDMLFFMEQERETCRSQMLYKAYLK